jgi:hypothetical protein
MPYLVTVNNVEKNVSDYQVVRLGDEKDLTLSINSSSWIALQTNCRDSDSYEECVNCALDELFNSGLLWRIGCTLNPASCIAAALIACSFAETPNRHKDEAAYVKWLKKVTTGSGKYYSGYKAINNHFILY